MLRVSLFAASLVAIGAFTGVSVASGGPMADAGLDQTVTVDTAVQLDGTGSGHPEGTLSGYEWTIRTPDGREIEPDCADCERSQFTPSAVGRYEVTLTVTGSDGDQSTDKLYVYVQDAGPEVELSGSRTPNPAESVTYTASAESPDAQLEEIAWAVEDEIVAVRSLDGTTDESELSLAFRDTETHRVQVVVRGTNGRTAYDQLFVQPQSGSSDGVSWSETAPQPDEGGCDSGSDSSDTVLCLDIESPERTPSESEEPTITGPFEVRYHTDGYEANPLAGFTDRDSSHVGTDTEEVGLDGGENAPWRRGVLEKSVDSAVSKGSRMIFGQEKKTVTCEIEGDETISRGCGQKVAELEEDGRTSNVYSPSTGGSYSEYGLTGGERVRGSDPTELTKGQKAEVTIVIQQEEDGVVDKVVDRAGASTDRIKGTMDGLLDDSDNSHSTSTGTSSGRSTSRLKGEDEDPDSGVSISLPGQFSSLQPGGGTSVGIGSEPLPNETETGSTVDYRSSSTSRSGARFAK